MAELLGINLDELEEQVVEKRPSIPVVPGRTVHIDADFMAYMVSYDDSKELEEMFHNADEMIKSIKNAAGAEFVALHLTPSGSNKGGRYEAALLKEYQGNRKNKPKPKWLAHIRTWLHKERDGIMHYTREADDGMSAAQYDCIAAGNKHLSVIATKDKDLLQVPGLVMDWDTGELTDTDDPFGWVDLVATGKDGKTKKLKGRGWIMFWAQMLTGDPADNIQGLPKIFINGKPKGCGPVAAYGILSKLKNNKQAAQTIGKLYSEYGKKIGFKNYRDGSKVSSSDAFLSEAKLLWMMRNDDPNDFIKWLQETA